MRRILELSGWLAKLRAHGVEVEFLDAPHVVRPIPQLFGGLAVAGEYGHANYFGWGLATEDDTRHAVAASERDEPAPDRVAEIEAKRADAACESVRHVERWIEQHAPIS
eukprot:scaffold6998_cov78-Phaeocystis_antarctica.AAC.1